MLHCFAGCPVEDVLAAKGLGFAALYPDGDEDRKPTPNLAPVLAAAEADERFLGRPTRLGVLRALVAVARRSARLDVHPGVRDLAAAAGVSEGTVKRSLADLKKWGFVTAGAGARKRSEAATWVLKPARAFVAHNITREQSARARGEEPEVASDLWRHQYLGPRARAIFRYVARYWKWEPTFEDIYQTVGAAKDRRTVRKHLAALVAHGLLIDTGSGYTLGPRSVEQVAASLGLAGCPVTAAQRRAHAAERAYFREALALVEQRRCCLVPGYALRGRTFAPPPCRTSEGPDAPPHVPGSDTPDQIPPAANSDTPGIWGHEGSFSPPRRNRCPRRPPHLRRRPPRRRTRASPP